MWTLEDYVEQAKTAVGVQSERALAKHLGLNPASLQQWRKGMAWPKDENIIELAFIVGRDPEIALLELSAWRTNGSARGYYQNLARKLQAAALSLLVFLAFSAPASAAPAVNNAGTWMHEIVGTIYIMCVRIGANVTRYFLPKVAF